MIPSHLTLMRSSGSPGKSRLRGQPHRRGRGHVGHHHLGGSTLQPVRVSSLGRDPERYRGLITSAGAKGRRTRTSWVSASRETFKNTNQITEMTPKVIF